MIPAMWTFSSNPTCKNGRSFGGVDLDFFLDDVAGNDHDPEYQAAIFTNLPIIRKKSTHFIKVYLVFELLKQVACMANEHPIPGITS